MVPRETAEESRRKLVYRFGRREYDLAERTHIMGILNVTPDSFSDGGTYFSGERAVERGLQMVGEGVDIIDVGGESTRPKSHAYGEGADPVPLDEELRRVLPVIETLTKHTDVPISIDTYKPAVAEQALAVGAVIVNDVSGFSFDSAMPEVVAKGNASAVVMHMKGTPKTMQMNPQYDDLFGEIIGFLEGALGKGHRAGIRQMIVDPGLGFGKTLRHNLDLMAGLSAFSHFGVPILVGPSRKLFIGAILDAPVEHRLEGSLAAAVACILNGAHILRVHDVQSTRKAALVADAIKRSTPQ
jgi:dihydropteroate synthase